MKSNPGLLDDYEQNIKCQELPFNQQQTVKLQNSNLYKRYKLWLKDHGVVMDPRIRYPSYFGQSGKGVVGISASKPIQKRKAIIAVPYNLLITVDTVKDDIELFQVVKENVHYFKGGDDAAMKLLLLFFTTELVKGEKSIYHPFFCISNEDFLNGWESRYLQMFQNRHIMKIIKQNKENMERQFMEFLRIFRRYQNLYPQKITNNQYKDIFEKAYIFIVTRAFGWSLPSISLIPLADSLNHGNIRYVNHFLVNKQAEKKAKPEEKISDDGYKQMKTQVNLSILKDQFFTLNEKQLAELRKQKKSRSLKFVEKHKDILLQSQKLQGKEQKLNLNPKQKQQIRNNQNHILYQQYKAGIHKISNLHFYESSCEEDNDTDQQYLFDRQMAHEKFTIYDQERQLTENNKKKQVNKLWKLYYLTQSQSEQSDQQQKKPVKKQDAESKKQLKQELQSKLLKQNDSSSVSYEDSEDEEDAVWDWVNKANHKQTFFIMSTKNVIRQNEQIYNFYGRRSNKFLLANYNFVLKDNIYDSFPLFIKLDQKLTTKVPASKLILFSKKEDNSTKSRSLSLKKYLINTDLINICRSYIILWTKKQWNNCRLTIPFDRQIEGKALELYQQVVKALGKDFTTTIEEDEQLEEEQKLKYEERTSIILRKEYKKILKGQQILITKTIQFLKKWEVKGIQKLQQADMKWVRRLKPYLTILESATTL